MYSLNRTARLTGFLYLLVVITGFFTLMYAPSKLFVPGDATAMASNILAHQSLFRAYIVVGLLSELLFIATVLMLYQLFKSVGPQLAILMVLLVLLDAPVEFASTANDIAALAFLRGADFLAVFDPPQQDALAVLLLKLSRHGALVSEIFWGLWLFPLGWLAYRSGFVPRLLGVWLIINGLAYLALSALGLLWPGYPAVVSTITTPILLGEVAFTLWLLIAGVRVRCPVAAVSP
ncbi:MAG: DUF4386 domain-containing protein [Rhodanobacter sp.]